MAGKWITVVLGNRLGRGKVCALPSRSIKRIMDKATQNYLELLEKRIVDLEKKIYIVTELSVQYTDRHILTNDRINEAFDVIKMLERKISNE